MLRERVRKEQHEIWRFQCSPYHLNSALHPVIEQLEQAAGFDREDGPERRLDKLQALVAGSVDEIAERAPLFASLLSLPVERYPPLHVSPQKRKEKILEALAGQVEALARRQPLLMLWEDVHWIDATSQEFMDLLVPRLRHLPVLVIVTYRPESTASWTDHAHVTTLGLNRLGRRQGAELVAKLTAGKALPQELLAALALLKDTPLDEALEQLTKTGLVFRRGTPPQATYTFKHALVQDTAYDSLLKSKRTQVHAHIAEVLERDFSGRVANEPELLAHHFTRNVLAKLVRHNVTQGS